MPLEATDGDLARAAAAGDEQACKQIYRRFVAPVRSLLVRMAGTGPLDDLTQETFLRAFRELRRLETLDTLGPWIRRIAANAAVDHLRQAARRKTTPFDAETHDAGVPDGAARHEHKELVTLALGALDVDHRAVLVLRDLEQLSEAETAAVLDVPLGTVKSRLFHARQTVRAFLASHGVTEISS
jgi:RNA polymerase sigma-70 factor (ECF subfamily)